MTQIEHLKKQLNELNDRERELEYEIDSLVSSDVQVNQLLQTLYQIQPQIDLVIGQSKMTYNMVNDTSQLADKISKQVRLLDSEHSQVKQTLDLVEDIQDIKVIFTALIYSTVW
jgi:prefoldin subunit 5